jgi:hypothetical protein
VSTHLTGPRRRDWLTAWLSGSVSVDLFGPSRKSVTCRSWGAIPTLSGAAGMVRIGGSTPDLVTLPARRPGDDASSCQGTRNKEPGREEPAPHLARTISAGQRLPEALRRFEPRRRGTRSCNGPGVRLRRGIAGYRGPATGGVLIMSGFVGPLRLHLISAVSLVAFVIVAPSAQAATPTCFDRAATITGAGTINGTAGNDVIVGSDGSDTIDGKGGNDRICGLGGADSLYGGRGDDQIDGAAGSDFIVGDVFAESGDVVGGGNDRLFGGNGDDNFMTGDSRTNNGNATGGGNDELFGGNGDDGFMSGDSVAVFGGDASGGGNDRLEGGDGNDGMAGDSRSPHDGSATGAGDDILLGGFGIFDFLIGDSEAVTEARGSGGDDILDMGADGGFRAIGDHNINSPESGGPPTGRATGAGGDLIIGGSANEVLIGDSVVADESVTAAGNDRIQADGGDDTIFGDNVNFDVDATAGTAGGADNLDGGGGNDTLRAGPGNDNLDGGPATDVCHGQRGTDTYVRCETVT